jgi:hypothetical protein
MQHARFLEIDKATSRGNIYPKAVVEKALQIFIEAAQENRFPIFRKPTSNPTPEDVVGVAENLRIEDGYLCGEVGFHEDYLKEIVSPTGEVKITIRPNGFGAADENGVIREGYLINGLTVRFKPETS